MDEGDSFRVDEEVHLPSMEKMECKDLYSI
jgi:hypothetical protein